MCDRLLSLWRDVSTPSRGYCFQQWVNWAISPLMGIWEISFIYITFCTNKTSELLYVVVLIKYFEIQYFCLKTTTTTTKTRTPTHKQAEMLTNCLPMQETQETRVWSLVWEDPLEEGMATHSSLPAWEIPCTEETGGLQSTGLQRGGHG